MDQQKECPQPPEHEKMSAWLRGYWDGYELFGKTNTYEKGTQNWRLYEAGYEEGWLDS